MKFDFKKFFPHIIALAVMLALSFVFFSASAFEGKVLPQPDNQKAGAAATEANAFYKETGKMPLWTNSMFSGMPAVQIASQFSGNMVTPVFRALQLGQGITAPHANIFLAMLCMYILLITLLVDWRVALIGAAAFGLSSFNMDIIEAGHSTQMVCLALAPLVLAGAINVFRGQYLFGGAVFALGFAMQLYGNHLQVTYYTAIILLILGITQLVFTIKSKNWLAFGKSAVTLVLAGLLAFGTNLPTVWMTNEYSSETIRGTSELQNSDHPKGGGLDKEYAFSWSYGIGESLTLIAQNAYGGGASQSHESTETFEKLRPQIASGLAQQGVPNDKISHAVDQQISGLFYTGDQPFVGVSIYWGALLIFFGVLGLFLLKGATKWWLGISSLVMLMISWGKNFFFATLMFDTFPLFNKFRAVTQALGLGQLLLVVLAALSIQALFDPKIEAAKKQRSLLWSTGICVLLCLFALFGGDKGARDAQLQPELVSMISADRAALARADVMRSLFLILAGAGLVWFYIKGRLKSVYLVAGVAALTLFDSWTIGKRIVNNDQFETKKEVQNVFTPKPADLFIQKDKDPHFRVLDLRQGNPFLDASTSAFHQSVGGYHAAKLMRYQDLIDKYLSKFDEKTPALFEQKNMPIYGMLNAKYVISKDDIAGVAPNPFACGNAWFVKNIRPVANADAELAGLASLNPKTDAIYDEKYAGTLRGFTPQFDSTAKVELTKYNPDRMEYKYTANGEQCVVFSEIYYPEKKGMSLKIDGNTVPMEKVDYLLRAARVPSGTHTMLMEFAPVSYVIGEKVSLFTSIALLLLFLFAIFQRTKQNAWHSPITLPDHDVMATATEKKTVAKTTEAKTAATPEVEAAKKTFKKK